MKAWWAQGALKEDSMTEDKLVKELTRKVIGLVIVVGAAVSFVGSVIAGVVMVVLGG